MKTLRLNLTQGKQIIHYYLLLFNFNTLDFVKFNQSIFFEDNFYQRCNTIVVEDFTSYNNQFDESRSRGISMLSVEKICVDKVVAQRLDLFAFREISITLYTTQAFKDFVERHNFVGLDLRLAEDLVLIE